MSAPVVVYSDDGQTLLGYRRSIADIAVALNGLTSGQKINVWNNLNAGAPKLYQTDDGNNAAGIAALDWLITFSTPAGSALTALELRIAACYVQDNPQYLQSPAFDPTINVKGYTPIT